MYSYRRRECVMTQGIAVSMKDTVRLMTVIVRCVIKYPITA